MRQQLSDKKVKKLREQLKLPIVYVAVRGGTHHRKDLYLEDGSITYLWPDGTVEKSPVAWRKA